MLSLKCFGDVVYALSFESVFGGISQACMQWVRLHFLECFTLTK